MKEGLLICSGGISTSMIASKLNEYSRPIINFEAKGVMTDTSWLEYLEDYSLILISPQIKHMREKLENDIQGEVKMIQIPPEFFNINSIGKFWETIKKEV